MQHEIYSKLNIDKAEGLPVATTSTGVLFCPVLSHCRRISYVISEGIIAELSRQKFSSYEKENRVTYYSLLVPVFPVQYCTICGTTKIS